MSSGNSSHQGILVAADGSERSDDAVRWAAVEAARRGEELSIVNAISPITGG